MSFTLESGVQLTEAYAASDAQNHVLVGGSSPGGSVGSAGGWVSGGGHSALAPNYGLGNLLSVSSSLLRADDNFRC